VLCKNHKASNNALTVDYAILCCEYYCMNMGKYFSCAIDLLYSSMGENISAAIYFQTTKLKASVSSIPSTAAKKDVKYKYYANKFNTIQHKMYLTLKA
jgi:hypothetical protein